MKTHLNHQYSDREEQLNILTHAVGLVLSIVALPFLIVKAIETGGVAKILSFITYGLSLIILYAASTCYHAAKDPKKRRRLNIFDHAAIYVLIAGTYTPFTLLVLDGVLGWTLFGLSWGFALIGIVLKLFFTGRFDKISTLMYVLMGWQIVFAIKPLINNLPKEGLYFLFLGGVFYTVGAIIYSIKRLKYNHALFHVFVVAGSISHFISVYFFV